MDIHILKIVGSVAGIGGLGIGAFLIIFRDIIRKNIFPNLTKEQAYKLFRLIIVLAWSIAVAGIAAWVYGNNSERKPSVLGPIDTHEMVFEAQTILKDVGYYSELVDGNFTDTIMQTVQRFQMENNIDPKNGHINVATLNLLREFRQRALDERQRIREHTERLIHNEAGLPKSFNAAQDFSIDSNPNGVWSYGWSPGGPAFFLYTKKEGSERESIWFEDFGLGCPRIWNNNTQVTIRSGRLIAPTGTLVLHPGRQYEISVLRWTAPNAGRYTIKGYFEGVDEQPTSTGVGVTYNSKVYLFTADINSFGEKMPFSTTQEVAAGDTIDFFVDLGRDGRFEADSTALSVTITHKRV